MSTKSLTTGPSSVIFPIAAEALFCLRRRGVLLDRIGKTARELDVRDPRYPGLERPVDGENTVAFKLMQVPLTELPALERVGRGSPQLPPQTILSGARNTGRKTLRAKDVARVVRQNRHLGRHFIFAGRCACCQRGAMPDNDERTRVAALGRSHRVHFGPSLSLSATSMRALAMPDLDGRSACDGR